MRGVAQEELAKFHAQGKMYFSEQLVFVGILNIKDQSSNEQLRLEEQQLEACPRRVLQSGVARAYMRVYAAALHPALGVVDIYWFSSSKFFFCVCELVNACVSFPSAV